MGRGFEPPPGQFRNLSKISNDTSYTSRRLSWYIASHMAKLENFHITCIFKRTIFPVLLHVRCRKNSSVSVQIRAKKYTYRHQLHACMSVHNEFMAPHASVGHHAPFAFAHLWHLHTRMGGYLEESSAASRLTYRKVGLVGNRTQSRLQYDNITLCITLFSK